MNKDVYIQLLDVESDDEMTEEQYVKSIYDNCANKYHRTAESGVYESDFWYDLFKTHEGDMVWLPANHEYVKMIRSNNSDNQYPGTGVFVDVEGTQPNVVIYEYGIVSECIHSLVTLCEKYQLKIIK